MLSCTMRSSQVVNSSDRCSVGQVAIRRNVEGSYGVGQVLESQLCIRHPTHGKPSAPSKILFAESSTIDKILHKRLACFTVAKQI